MRTFLGWVIAAAVIGAIYAAVMFLPVYVAHFDVQDAANSAFNGFKDLGEAGVRQVLLQQLNSEGFGHHEELDEDGAVVVKPGIGLKDDDLTVQFDDNTKILWVHLEYSKKVALKPTEKVRFVKFTFDRKEKPPNVW